MDRATPPALGVLAPVCLVTALTAGCATTPATLYDWGIYPEALAAHIKESGGDAARQASRLEDQLQRAAGTARGAPPGLHAHLALLHTHLGNEATALRHLQAEKARYPESATYMDFLIRNARRTAPATAPEAPK
jgi:hypothetical protein